MKKYKLLDHTADIGIEVWGKNKKGLFSRAVTAMFDLIVDLKNINNAEKKVITIEGTDTEDLLINFLREALYLCNGEGWLVKSCQPLHLTKNRIVVQLQGEPYNSQKHHWKREIKAVTYYGLSIKKTTPGWKAKVIFDV